MSKQPRQLPFYTIPIRIALAVVALWFSGLTIANPAAAEELASGTGSRKIRREVVKSLPYDRMNQSAKVKISEVLNKPSLYRRLPVTSIEMDPEYLQFLIRYPEVVVGIWEIMGITQMDTQRVGDYHLKTNDGAGTTSDVELIFGSNDLHIFHASGLYEGPVLKKQLKGECVIIMRSQSVQPTVGGGVIDDQRPNHPQCICTLDVFLKLESATAGLVAKSISPIVGPTADHNFVESLKFLQRLNETTVKNGPGVQQMANDLAITPDVRRKFQTIAGNVYQRARQRQQLSSSSVGLSSQNPGSTATASQATNTGYPYRQQAYLQPSYPPSQFNSYYYRPSDYHHHHSFYRTGPVATYPEQSMPAHTAPHVQRALFNAHAQPGR